MILSTSARGTVSLVATTTKETALDDDSLQLRGSISPCIGNMSFLWEVRLQNNQFSHMSPGEISKPFRLQSLRLKNSSLGGDIPENISNCVKLIHLVGIASWCK
ncbi:hypothetical protein ACOSP7_032987 [Xanthoceras sorbifolium]